MSLIGRENVYTCEKCGGLTVTVDRDDGVTPMFLGCRAVVIPTVDGGFVPTCKGMAASSMYPTGPRPPHIPAPAWEWYKPDVAEIRTLSQDMAQHVAMGGLLIRRITDGASL